MGNTLSSRTDTTDTIETHPNLQVSRGAKKIGGIREFFRKHTALAKILLTLGTMSDLSSDMQNLDAEDHLSGNDPSALIAHAGKEERNHEQNGSDEFNDLFQINES